MSVLTLCFVPGHEPEPTPLQRAAQARFMALAAEIDAATALRPFAVQLAPDATRHGLDAAELAALDGDDGASDPPCELGYDRDLAEQLRFDAEIARDARADQSDDW